ncbi:uncharacterized protein N7518_010116 [Penicillium psychrosexuale]|uniref:uncharacterized protein n=1 Tax=Penicillium psychrosexuale TaxID=1002107 RepID=UPI00254528AC|nr:uncharacterized protein N7518_010116 [Penicillium psychrosexuale]KAJ5781633.1 hypothetical protein N7518_010116 [Penicillium psychrosexuale]
MCPSDTREWAPHSIFSIIGSEHSWFISDFEILYDAPARKISLSSKSDAEGFLNQAKGHV